MTLRRNNELWEKCRNETCKEKREKEGKSGKEDVRRAEEIQVGEGKGRRGKKMRKESKEIVKRKE